MKGKTKGCLVCSVALTLAMAGTLSAQASVGSISGRVTFAGKAESPRQVKADKDVEICAVHPIYTEELVVSEKGELQNVVVQVVGAAGELPNAKTRSTITQKGCQFTPHVQVIPAGSRLNIMNEDGIAHNVHTLSIDNPSFNQQQPGARKRIVTKKKDFTIPETIPVKCDIHGWMKAWIIVADHPYHAVSEADGSFSIAGVPAGTHKIEFWHESLGKQTREVTVAAGADTKVDLVFSGKK